MSDTATAPKAEKAKAAPKAEKAKGAAARILTPDGVIIPSPRIDVVPEQKTPAPPKKKMPDRPADVRARFALDSDQNRLARLRQLARHDRNVAWLLSEYERLTAPKKS